MAEVAARREEGKTRQCGSVRSPVSTPALCFFVFLCSATFLPAARSVDYAQALTKSLLYFEAQRSGRLPYNQRVSWRDHSGITDGLEQGVDLVGGYYDAGDHVKFGLPMAFTVTMLSWGVIQYGSSIAAAGELRHAMAAIKWGTDYFIKAHTAPNVLWAQVGDGDSDHYCWQRAEDMTTPRRAYRIDDRHPGSEIAGETAAAMAAAAVVFRETDPHYSRLLLAHARQVWELGERYRGRYDESVAAARGFYGSVSGYGDELLWGAAWLYVAGAGEEYLDYVLRHAHDLGGATWAMTEFSWDAKYAGLQVLAAKLLVEGRHRAEQIAVLEQYRSKAEHYLCACLGKNNRTAGNVRRTSAGLLYVRPWNNIQYVTSAAFLLALYSDVLRDSGGKDLRCPGGSVAPAGLLRFARSQVDYILGANPMNRSYLVGFGRRFPTRVHHRGASMPAHKGHRAFIGCTQGYDEWYGRAEANPNVLDGAVVGGPDWEDRFREDRGNYMQTEACTYNTAPLVGVLARLAKSQPRAASVASW